jgi:hypothetical protein
VPSNQKLASSPNITTPRQLAAFFDRRELHAEPVRLRVEVGTRELLPRSLHREAELVQQARHVVVVVPNAEAVMDEVADHGPRPHARAVSGRDRPRFDHAAELIALLIREPPCAARCLAREESFDAVYVVPTEPLVDRAARDAELSGEANHGTSLDVSEDRAPATPTCEVGLLVGLRDERAQFLLRVRGAALRADGLARCASTHGILRRDRAMLFPPDPGSMPLDPRLRDPV